MYHFNIEKNQKQQSFSLVFFFFFFSSCWFPHFLIAFPLRTFLFRCGCCALFFLLSPSGIVIFCSAMRTLGQIRYNRVQKVNDKDSDGKCKKKKNGIFENCTSLKGFYAILVALWVNEKLAKMNIWNDKCQFKQYAHTHTHTNHTNMNE